MFVKIHTQIAQSSIMEEDITTRYIWLMMLVLADRDGIIDATLSSIARKINVDQKTVEVALKKFMSPDFNSRNLDNEGRRIEQIRPTFGWKINNYTYYRDLRNEEDRREYMQKYMSEQRAQKKEKNNRLESLDKKDMLTPVNIALTSVNSTLTMLANTDLDTDLDTDLEKEIHVELNAEDEIFEFWKKELNHPKSKLDKKRKKSISDRLKEGYSISRIKDAISGIKKSAFHMGDNKGHTIYDDIELICRSGANIDKFADLLIQKQTGVYNASLTKQEQSTNRTRDAIIRFANKDSAEVIESGYSEMSSDIISFFPKCKP